METRQMYSKAEKLVKFSEWLRKEMKRQEMSSARLARLSGVHPNTIRNYLAERCEPTLFNVQCIVLAFGHDLGVLYKDDFE